MYYYYGAGLGRRTATTTQPLLVDRGTNTMRGAGPILAGAMTNERSRNRLGRANDAASPGPPHRRATEHDLVYTTDQRPAVAGAPMAGGRDAATKPGRPGRPSGHTYINSVNFASLSQQCNRAQRAARRQPSRARIVRLCHRRGPPQGGARSDVQAGRQNTRSSQSATERVDPNVAAKRRTT